MKILKVGLIGFGLSGRVFHAPFIEASPKFELTKIYSSRKDEIKKTYPNTKVVNDLKLLIFDQTLDLIIITSPNTVHYEQCKMALNNGLHVIVEKPFVINSKEGEKLIQLAKQQQKVLAVFQNRRWDGDFMTVKQIIKGGLIGDISEYESHFDRFRPELDMSNWRSQNEPGAGELYNLGPHLIDQAIHLFGAPEAVFADLRIARNEGTEIDTFDVKLYYKHFRAVLKAGVLVKDNALHFSIHGSKGSFIKSGLDPQEALLKEGAKPLGNNWGKDNHELYGKLSIQIGDMESISSVETLKGNYMGFFENVYHAITMGTPLEVTPEEALLNIKIIETAIKSAEEGRKLPFH